MLYFLMKYSRFFQIYLATANFPLILEVTVIIEIFIDYSLLNIILKRLNMLVYILSLESYLTNATWRAIEDAKFPRKYCCMD